MLIKYSITVTTSGTTGEGYFPPTNGRIMRISYVKDNYTTNCDFTITGEKTGSITGEGIWTQLNVNDSVIKRPRMAVQNNVGGDITYDGSEKVCEPYVLKDERVKVAIAQAGDGENGTFEIVVDQE